MQNSNFFLCCEGTKGWTGQHPLYKAHVLELTCATAQAKFQFYLKHLKLPLARKITFFLQTTTINNNEKDKLLIQFYD